MPRSPTVLDSGTHPSLFNRVDMFEDLEPVSGHVELADGRRLPITGRGTVECMISDTRSSSSQRRVTLRGALLVPGLRRPLLGLRHLQNSGVGVSFPAGENEVLLTVGDAPPVHVAWHAATGLYLVYTSPCPRIDLPGAALAARAVAHPDRPADTAPAPARTGTDPLAHVRYCHERMAHTGIDKLPALTSNWPPLQRVTARDVARARAAGFDCVHCVQAKATIHPHPPSPGHKAPRPLHTIAADIFQGLGGTTPDGTACALTVQDTFSRYLWIFPLRAKSEAAAVLRSHLTWLDRAFSHNDWRVAQLWTDGGTEFKPLRGWLAQTGVQHTITAPHDHAANGVLERAHRTLAGMARASLRAANMAEDWWPEAASYSALVMNASTNRTLPGLSPFERLYGRPFDTSVLHPFGCSAYVFRPTHRKGDTSRTEDEGIHLGYDISSRCWTIRVPRDDKWVDVQSRSVTFRRQPFLEGDDEDRHPLPRAAAEEVTDPDFILGQANSAAPHLITAMPTAVPEAGELSLPLADVDIDETPAVPPSALLGRAMAAIKDMAPSDPNFFSYRAAVEGPYGREFRQAIADEHDNMIDRFGALRIVPRPEGVRTMPMKLVLSRRVLPDGAIKYKARAVARGDLQPGDTFDLTSSPVATHSALTALIVSSVQAGFFLGTFDVKAAYLSAPLDEEIYLTPPRGWDVPPGHCYRAERAVYGLKQSGRAWYRYFAEILSERLGFRQSLSEPCCFTRENAAGTIRLGLFVDDVLAGASSAELFQTFLAELETQGLTLSSSGPLSTFLGALYTPTTNGGYAVSQRTFIDSILRKFGVPETHLHRVPVHPDLNLVPRSADEEPASPTEHNRYRAIVGSLLWLARITRPDLCYGVRLLCRFAADPSKQHQQAAWNMLGYVQATRNMVMHLAPDMTWDPLVLHVDANFGARDGRNISGIVAFLWGVPVLWDSHRQTLVTSSTAAAEYVANGEGLQQAQYLRNVLVEFGVLQPNHPIRICSDSQAAYGDAIRVGTTGRLRHLDYRYHALRTELQRGRATLEHIPGPANAADMLTKALPRPLLQRSHGMVRLSGG